MVRRLDMKAAAPGETEDRWRDACADVVSRNPWGSLPAVFERYDTKLRNQMIREFALPAHKGDPGAMKPLLMLLTKRMAGEIEAEDFRVQVERMAP